MYITYHSDQQCTEPGSKSFWLDAKGGDYRPHLLIRTSDWKVVPGDEAVNGYCALSYSWEQSGELVKADDGKIDCNDNGRHRLITKKRTEHITRRSTRFRRHTTSTYVPFTGILQQICKDFKITYLWYDKECINQLDSAQRRREIRQMYKIYGNACFTLALVPEVNIPNASAFRYMDRIYGKSTTHATNMAMSAIPKSSWWTRSWTLEELMMSRKILIVGTNAHVWNQAPFDGELLQVPNFMTTILSSQNMGLKRANHVFRYAQFRTSSKEHDKMFSLLNIFQGTISMDTTYKSNILDTVRSFFRKLVKHDLSIMCFGSVRNTNWSISYRSTFSHYNLPSWTGVFGRHSHDSADVITLQQGTTHVIDDAMRLHIKCKYFAIRPTQFDDISFHYQKERIAAAVKRMQQAGDKIENIPTDDPTYMDVLRAEMIYMSNLVATHWWETDSSAFYPLTVLSLTEDCNEECIVLSIIFHSTSMKFNRTVSGFNIRYNHAYFLPVLKKSSGTDTYKAVGIILLKKYRSIDTPEDPRVLLDKVFNNRCKEFKEVTIE